MKESNIFSDFKLFKNKASKRSSETNLDEVLIAILIIMWTATVYILLTGGYYHYQIFKTASGKASIAIAASLLFFIGGEFAKIKLGRLTMWGILSGDWVRTWRRLAIYAVLVVGQIGVYWWSIDVTAKNAPTLNNLLNKSGGVAMVDSTQLRFLESELATVNGQIKNAENEAANGLNSKWQGATTAAGLATANAAIKSKNTLLAQQTDLRKQLNDERLRLQGLKNAQYDGATVQISSYGWIAECTQIFTIFLWVLIGLELVHIYDKKAKESNEKQPISPTPTYSVLKPVQVATTTPSVTTSDERPKIGFKYGEKEVVDTNTQENAVTQVYTNTQEIKVIPRSPLQLLADLNLYTKRIAAQELKDGKASDANLESQKRIFNNLITMGYNPIWNGQKYVFADKGVKS